MKTVDYYADPKRYEAEYAPFCADRSWYVRRAAECGSPVLELGCGTGRILFALAAEGLEVDGIDKAPAMLDQARTRATLLAPSLTARVGLHEADLTAFALCRTYRAVLAPLNCMMHLLSDAEFLRCLERVKAHLAPDGRFLLDLSQPRPELIAAASGPEGVPLRRIRVRGIDYLQREWHRYDAASRISLMRYTFEPFGSSAEAFASELLLRMYPADEVRRLTRLAGLRILERYGGFDQHPPDPHNDVMQLYVAGHR